MLVQHDTTAAQFGRSLHSLIHRQQPGQEAHGIRSGIRLSLGATQSLCLRHLHGCAQIRPASETESAIRFQPGKRCGGVIFTIIISSRSVMVVTIINGGGMITGITTDTMMMIPASPSTMLAEACLSALAAVNI
jgi:hypothetical protein